MAYWRQSADERLGNPPPPKVTRSLQWSKTRTEDSRWAWGEQVHGCDTFFPSEFCHCWLGDRKGIWPVKKLWGLVCLWLWFDWSFARLIAPVVHHPQVSERWHYGSGLPELPWKMTDSAGKYQTFKDKATNKQYTYMNLGLDLQPLWTHEMQHKCYTDNWANTSHPFQNIQ